MKKVLATFHCLRNQFPQLPELASKAMFPTFLGLFRSFAQKLLNFLALGRARFRDTVLPKEANVMVRNKWRHLLNWIGNLRRSRNLLSISRNTLSHFLAMSHSWNGPETM